MLLNAFINQSKALQVTFISIFIYKIEFRIKSIEILFIVIYNK